LKYAKVEMKVMVFFYKIGFINLPFFIIFAPLKFLLRTLFSPLLGFSYRLVRRLILP
jgi:hypothetical protein